MRFIIAIMAIIIIIYWAKGKAMLAAGPKAQLPGLARDDRALRSSTITANYKSSLFVSD